MAPATVNCLKRYKYFLVGFLFLSFLCGITILQGENSYIFIHDQFDGEVFSYLLHANHLGETIYPELMNGLPKTGVQLASPATLFFYLILPPINAYLWNLFFVAIIGYIGLYLFLTENDCKKSISAISALLFALLPFYSVYGLSIMGLPLFFYSILKLKRVNSKREIFLCYGIVFLYGIFSSMALIGYAVLLVLGVVVIGLFTFRKYKWAVYALKSEILLLVTYVVCNSELILQLLGRGGTSHREEMLLEASPFSFQKVFSMFINGQYHAVSNHRYLILLIAGVFFVSVVAYRAMTRQEKEKFVKILALSLFAFCIALIYAAYTSTFIVNWRNTLPGALRSFQADRFYWFYPFIWYANMGLSLDLGWNIFSRMKGRVLKSIFAIFSGTLIAMTLFLSRNNILFKNFVQDILPRDSSVASRLSASNITWEEFVATDIFSEIEKDIDKVESEYRVISIGLYPTVALYNGFFCLDGYSNNYPLDYKHEFYQIIKDELELAPELKAYYCDWGNRCYAYTHELKMQYMISKNSDLKIQDLCLDLDAFEKMGGKYIFSAVEIVSHQKYGLTLVGSYETDESYYRVWVYSL